MKPEEIIEELKKRDPEVDIESITSRKKLSWFNPTAKDFLEANKEKTMVGLAWSLYWRLYAVVLAIYALVVVFILIIESL